MAKRFYETVDVKATSGGFHITLDGRVLKTPGKKQLICETKNQAGLVADEWRAQEDDIKPETMPCTRLVNVACELTSQRRPELVAEFRKYSETDLLCYRTASPADLAERQMDMWQPILDWAATEQGIKLATSNGLSAIAQPEQSLVSSATYAEKLSDTQLTLLLHFTASLGSSILALAVREGHLGIQEAFDTSRLDEHFQNERWGEDEEAVTNRELLRNELIKLAKLL